MTLKHDTLLAGIRAANAALLAEFDPDACIGLLDGVPADRPYHDLPEAVRRLWATLADRHGEDGFAAFQKAALLRLIARWDGRGPAQRYTAAIRACFERSFARIVRAIADPACTTYRTVNDLLLKDLALCRQAMFPAGAQVVEPDSTFHRALIFRGGVSQALAMSKLLLRTGGNGHWYQIHTHLSELEDFNPEGWDRCYERIAGMLELHPEIRGMWGGSWFYDPALEEISPRLAYLRRVPQANGASVFYSDVDVEGGALSKSESRRAAYQSGRYLPKAYALIWPRRALIAWARAQERDPETGAADERVLAEAE